MNFCANNLDNAYQTICDLFTYSVFNCEKFKQDLRLVISNLQLHWRGSDASFHINNLSSVLTELYSLINDVQNIAHSTSVAISKAQILRSFTGGSNNVGDIIPVSEENPEHFSVIDTTEEYYIDYLGAQTDYNELSEFSELFTKFCNKFHDYEDELFKNWESGTDRDNVLIQFEEITKKISDYVQKITNAKDNLGTALLNLQIN